MSGSATSRSVEGVGATLRVTQLIQCFTVGGIETMVHRLALALGRHGVACDVVGYVEDGALRHAMAADGVAARFLGSRREGLRPALGPRLARHLRARRTDLLHSHHLGPFLYGTVGAAMALRPHVHTEHSVELYDAPRRRLAARLMPRLSRLVAVAPEVAGWRGRELGHTPDVIPNGVPVPETAPDLDARRAARDALGLPADAEVVGCVARLADEKDHATLLAAMAEVAAARPDAQLVLAGDGPRRRDVEARARRPDLAGRVHVLGTRTDLDRVYPAFDLFALASRREGLPLAALEAMGHAIPVVATAVGGLPGLLGAGGGTTVPPGDAHALAKALLGYLDAPDRRATDGARARRQTVATYSLDAMAARYAALYRDVAAGGLAGAARQLLRPGREAA